MFLLPGGADAVTPSVSDVEDVRLRFGRGLTRLRVGNSGTSKMGDEPRYIVWDLAGCGTPLRCYELWWLNVMCFFDGGSSRGIDADVLEYMNKIRQRKGDVDG